MDVHSDEAQPDITSPEVKKSPSNGVTSSGGAETEEEVVPVRPTELEMVEDEGAADVMIEMTENCPLTPVTSQLVTSYLAALFAFVSTNKLRRGCTWYAGRCMLYVSVV